MNNPYKKPVRITITGAAGQIGYQLLFRIAAGEMLGSNQPVILQLLDLPQAQNALKGVVMELNDCAFPLLQKIIYTEPHYPSTLSPQLRDLLSHMLCKNPLQRISLNKIKEHPWLSSAVAKLEKCEY